MLNNKFNIIRNVDNIDGLSIIEHNIFSDNRGFFKESYNSQGLLTHGINSQFVQDNEVYSKKNVLRGFHINLNHPQAKLIHVIHGEIFDVVIDLRNTSKTYKKCYSTILSDKNKKELFIPEGFAHGYLALKDSYVFFKVTTHYIPNDEISFAWNSKNFEINWPILNPILNENDRISPEFSELLISGTF